MLIRNIIEESAGKHADIMAVKWLANYLITTKILTNDPEFLSTEAYRAELRRAETRQDPAYFALLWIQQLRSLTKE